MFRKKYIIILLSIICIAVGIFYISTIPSVRSTWVLATTVQPETFTELYFEDHLKLPKKAIKDESYEFSFTIHNLEYKKINYPYEIYIQYADRKQTLDKKTITLNHDATKTITVYFKIVDYFDRARVVINLINKNQEIAFWMEGETLPAIPSPTSAPIPTPTPIKKEYGAWYWQPDLNRSQAWLGKDKAGKDIWSDQFPPPTPTKKQGVRK